MSGLQFSDALYVCDGHVPEGPLYRNSAWCCLSNLEEQPCEGMAAAQPFSVVSARTRPLQSLETSDLQPPSQVPHGVPGAARGLWSGVGRAPGVCPSDCCLGLKERSSSPVGEGGLAEGPHGSQLTGSVLTPGPGHSPLWSLGPPGQYGVGLLQGRGRQGALRMKGTVPPPLLLPVGLSKTGAAGHPPRGSQGRGAHGEEEQCPGTWSYQRPVQHGVLRTVTAMTRNHFPPEHS